MYPAASVCPREGGEKRIEGHPLAARTAADRRVYYKR